MFRTVRGDLTRFPCDVIVQQSNCLTTRPHGLSHVLARRVGVDAYAGRHEMLPNVATVETRPVPGSIRIQPIPTSSPKQRRFVVSLHAQYMPGRVGDGRRTKFERERQRAAVVETRDVREAWFRQCLAQLATWISADPTIRSVAFPHGIGCGLAGGTWATYERMIREFHATLTTTTTSGVDVTLVQLSG